MSQRAVLMSIKPKVADLIFTGTKTIELRRRKGGFHLPQSYRHVGSEELGKLMVFALGPCRGVVYGFPHEICNLH